MKLNCPACSVMLELDDSLAKTLVRCPKCEQSFVVPQVPPPLIAQKPNLKIEQPPDEYELSASPAEEAANVAGVDPDSLKFCPGCGAKWRKGSVECNACHFVPALGAQLKPREKEKLDLRVNLQKVYLVIFIGGAAYGGYELYNHWNAFCASIRSIWPS